jgi:hypothetical protein
VSDRESLDFPVGRWILWGVLAIAALGGILYFLFGRDTSSEEETPPPASGEQLEWSIVLTDQTGATVILKGDLPRGFPTETWEGESMITRDVSGSFEWDLDAELPVAVVEIDQTDDCAALNETLAGWVSEVGAAEGEAVNLQARAFAQHALNHMRSVDCEIDESVLADI